MNHIDSSINYCISKRDVLILSPDLPSGIVLLFFCGSSSVGRASAFQAECREFEPRLPLKCLSPWAKPSMLSIVRCCVLHGAFSVFKDLKTNAGVAQG
jgi:hypothetical protein